MLRAKKNRSGAVTVEFAFALPILLLFTFTGLEFARVNMIRNTAVNAAYEGAREGILPGATAAECEAAANLLLDIIDVNGYNVVATPDPILPNSQTITVTVTVPLTSANSFVTPKFYLGTNIVTSVTLPRERQF